ncbi:hypothetical protein MKW94_015604, partial [Papaver nudicaule]|nr:hypothetical protein [Papaver nudicaule]
SYSDSQMPNFRSGILMEQHKMELCRFLCPFWAVSIITVNKCAFLILLYPLLVLCVFADIGFNEFIVLRNMFNEFTIWINKSKKVLRIGKTTFFQILRYLVAQSSKAKENSFQKQSSPSTGAPPAPPSPKAADSPTYLRKQPTSPSTVIKCSVSQRSKAESVTLQQKNTQTVVVHEKNLSVGDKTHCHHQKPQL